MNKTGIKSMVLTLAFTVAIFAGATQTFAKPNDNSTKATKEIKVTVPKESKLKGNENAKAHGGNAYAKGKVEKVISEGKKDSYRLVVGTTRESMDEYVKLKESPA